jgi:hypothetical protein
MEGYIKIKLPVDHEKYKNLIGDDIHDSSSCFFKQYGVDWKKLEYECPQHEYEELSKEEMVCCTQKLA